MQMAHESSSFDCARGRFSSIFFSSFTCTGLSAREGIARAAAGSGALAAGEDLAMYASIASRVWPERTSAPSSSVRRAKPSVSDASRPSSVSTLVRSGRRASRRN
eukprot:Mycagemm_TRINITY_DN10122_c0_g1::TRINITY_DN10122_c0_g1_i1::g.5117::m.5117 type:complete len:105 gc:universal TRINITY_DN10122_c0_g1_i1:588-274(-)